MKKYIKTFLFFFGSLVLIAGCSAVKQLSDALENLRRVQFKIAGVTNFRIAGIDVSYKKKISDFSVSEALQLTNAFASRRLVSDFILNVDARNPNDGSAQKTTNSTAQITNFDWRLLIDDTPTVNGNIASPVSVPGKGQTVVIPLAVNLDLYEFFGKAGYDRVINLALAIAGEGGSSRIKLDAKPTVRIGSFPITYPGRITIVDYEFRD
ncbi:MAG TPA: hypothetical protein PLV01_00850 [Candidatus Kapabacteria bacterium]|mgnify:FL=1|nr:hypothetical protein [Candidatus Kapabacteria bacterium]